MEKLSDGRYAGVKKFGAWVGLALLSGLAIYYLRAMLLYVGLLVVQNPALRPRGWTTPTLYGVNRCLFVILGAGWIMFTSYVGNFLMDSKRRRWERHIGRIAMFLGGIAIGSYLLLFILSTLFPSSP